MGKAPRTHKGGKERTNPLSAWTDPRRVWPESAQKEGPRQAGPKGGFLMPTLEKPSSA